MINLPRINRDKISEYLAMRRVEYIPKRKVEDIVFRFDSSLGLIYTVSGQHKESVTYIAKARDLKDVYKFGRTKEPLRRFAELSSGQYHGIVLTPIAFLFGDSEGVFRTGIFTEAIMGAADVSTAEELVTMPEDDLSFIIEKMGFLDIKSNPVPKYRIVTTIDYFDTDGKYVETKYKTESIYEQAN